VFHRTRHYVVVAFITTVSNRIRLLLRIGR
jgi:hypothetical protein